MAINTRTGCAVIHSDSLLSTSTMMRRARLDERQSDSSPYAELPDTAGYSEDCNLAPWKSLEYEKQLHVVCGDRNEAIKHAINWVYSSDLFPELTDYYAAGAWAVLAHGLVRTRDGIPTSDWICDEPEDWKITNRVMRERVNRAYLKFPVSTAFVISSKACWWVYDDPDRNEPHNDTVALFKQLTATISQWASTRQVLSLAGVKGVIEEYDVFDCSAQRLRIAAHLKPYFLHSPLCYSAIEALFNPYLLQLIKYWPDVNEINSLLKELKAFRANGARYHFYSEFLTGKPRESWNVRSFNDRMDAICDVLNDPSALQEESHMERLEAFDEDFLRRLVGSHVDGKLEEFLYDLTPTVTDRVFGAITEEVEKMKMG